MNTPAYAADPGTRLKEPKHRSKCTVLLIDSRDRDYELYPSPSEYVLDLPRAYQGVTNARMLSAELPTSFYVFASAFANTTLKVTVTVASVPVSKTITIADGNYIYTSMSTALVDALNTAYVSDGYTFAAVVSTVTQKMTISCTSHPSTSTLAIDTTAYSSSTLDTEWGLGYYLGFLKGVVASGTTDAGSVTSPGVASMNPFTYMLLDIDELNNVDESALGGGGMGPGTFAKIPFNCHSTVNNVFYDKTITNNALSPPRRKLDKIHIKFRFHGGQTVDFHGMEHSITLELTCSDERGDAAY